jgi:hypothetical protein
MPLNPHNLDALNAALAGSPSLHRANSLPQRGGLRRLKIASASGQSNGSESSASEMSPPQNGRVLDRESPTPGNKRASVLFPEDHAPGMGMGIGIGLAPYHLPRPLRVPSVSPLTLGGLRAAYLGVHLKRRRVACCLLGLALEADEQYWAKVCDTLRALSAALSAACARLSGVRADAEKEALAARALSNAAASPVASPSTAVPAASLGAFPGDFVPPDRSAAAVLANMDELQRALARVWTRCEEMRASVSAGEDVDVLEAWAAVRADIGGMLRNVERGRELAQRDEVIVEDDDDTPEADEMARAVTSSPLPEFMRAWGPGPAELSEGEVEVEDVSMRELAEDAEDVQIGADEVFEADIPAASATLRAPSILSREERIALSREARERGLTLAQLTKVREDPEAAERERERAANLERQRATSEMMCELEGMFGEIRRRKGMPGE